MSYLAIHAITIIMDIPGDTTVIFVGIELTMATSVMVVVAAFLLAQIRDIALPVPNPPLPPHF